MSNHFTDTTDGVRISIYDDGAEYTGPTITATSARPARSERDQLLDRYQLLLDWLRARPIVELHPYQLADTWYVKADTDDEGAARMEQIAAALGAKLTPGGVNHHYVITVEYAPRQTFTVVYITHAYSVAHKQRTEGGAS